MRLGRQQPTDAHRAGVDGSQPAPGPSHVNSDETPTPTQQDEMETMEDGVFTPSASADAPSQERLQDSLSRRFIDVPVDAPATPAEPRRRISIVECFTGDSGAPGGFPRSRSFRGSGASSAPGAIMRRLSSHFSKATQDPHPANNRQSIDRRTMASGAPNDLLRHEGINRSPVDAQEGIARKGRDLGEAARRFASKLMTGDEHRSLRQRFRQRRRPEKVTTDTTDMKVDTTDERSADVGPGQQ